MIKHSPNPPPSYDASLLRDAADRAINHYLHPEPPPQPLNPATRRQQHYLPCAPTWTPKPC